MKKLALALMMVLVCGVANDVQMHDPSTACF